MTLFDSPSYPPEFLFFNDEIVLSLFEHRRISLFTELKKYELNILGAFLISIFTFPTLSSE
jgi:hypothetical protein